MGDGVCKKFVNKQNQKKNVMQLFSKAGGEVVYTVTIKNVLQFELAMDFVGISMSFWQMAEAI